MEIKRDSYLKQLIDSKHNGVIKIITGLRRSGKSYLLFKIFKRHLLDSGIPQDHIIEIILDDMENEALLERHRLYEHIKNLIVDSEPYYVLLDEVQLVDGFESVLNSLLHKDNLDIYVTGSNSRFLSTDIITEFRGRGEEIHVFPLSFAEYASAYPASQNEAWNQYLTYGGLPYTLLLPTAEKRAEYLGRLFQEVYLKDIQERHKIRHLIEMEELIDVLASAVGSLSNPTKLANTFKSARGSKLSANTIASYGKYLEDAFMLSKARRYDIKGKHYINTTFKYYFEDTGLRNARLNFRQTEENHLMENMIYNELRRRGFGVDVGIIEAKGIDAEGKSERKTLEVDFVANQGSQRYYIQSAFQMPDDEKREQEYRPLRKIGDSFKKIIIVRDEILRQRNNDGFVIMGIQDFMLNEDSLSW